MKMRAAGIAVAAFLWCASDGLAQFTFNRCGNGRINTGSGEQCDGANLGGATCEGLGFTGGTLACSSSCKYDTSGCTNVRFIDLGLTVFDNETGLEWEKKTNDGGVHDVDNEYTWTTPVDPQVATTPDGPLFTTFLGTLNDCVSGNATTVTNGFAGYCDWRIPQIDELKSILTGLNDDCTSPPCIDPIFGPTSSASYWSATSTLNFPYVAWTVNFGLGFEGGSNKSLTQAARAVRGPHP